MRTPRPSWFNGPTPLLCLRPGAIHDFLDFELLPLLCQSTKPVLLILHLFIFVGGCHSLYVATRGQSEGLVLSFHHAGTGHRTQVVRLSSKRLYPLSPPASPWPMFCFVFYQLP